MWYLAGLAAWLVIHVPTATAQEQTAPATTEHGLEVYVSQDALQALYSRQAELPEIGAADLRAGFFFNEQRNMIGIADVLMPIGEPAAGMSRWRAHAGARAYGALLDNDNDAFSIGFGGTVSYFLSRDQSMAVALSAFYAPDITTFGSPDGIRDVSVEFQTRVTPTLHAFVGYRTLEFDLPVDMELDDGLHIGVRARF